MREISSASHVAGYTCVTLAPWCLKLYPSWEFFTLWVLIEDKDFLPLEVAWMPDTHLPRLLCSQAKSYELAPPIRYTHSTLWLRSYWQNSQGQGVHSLTLSLTGPGSHRKTKIKFSSENQPGCKLSVECMVTDSSRGLFIRTALKHVFGPCSRQLNLKLQTSWQLWITQNRG